MATITRAIAVTAMAIVASSVGASVPPSDWKAPTWKGPGLLCGAAFTLRLQPGETAVQGFPSVGLVPFTVDTGGTRFGVVEAWFGPSEPARRKLVRKLAGGKLFALEGLRGESSRSFLFVPTKKKALAFRVTFYHAIAGHTDAFPQARERTVLERLTFASATPLPCLKNVHLG